MVLSVFLLDGECRIAPLKIEEETISDPEWRYFRSVIEDIRVMGESHKLAFKEHDSIPQETKKIILLLADPQLNLSNPATLQSLAGHYLLRWVSTNHPRLPAASAEKPALFYAPIITIGYEDIMSTYSLPRALEETDPEKRRMRDYDMDSRYKFLDSSIWHRYVPTYSGDDYVFRERFKAVLQEVIQHHEDELYRTNAARAMLEFQLRMMRESYIYPVGERNHSRMVTPFKFHSETQMREKAEQLMKDYFKANDLNKKLQWRFLLIDDYASVGISADNKDNIKLSKKGLIRNLLKGLDEIKIDHPKEPKSNGGASSTSDLISKCLDLLEGPKRYDVLLLDYLLAGVSGKAEEREYGFELLQLLQMDSRSEAPKYKRGPFMRHWIFPISSFPFALYDKLRQLGIDNYFHLWHLSGGGDPITTPQLFRYYLLSFLQQQTEEVFLRDKTLSRYLSIYSEEDSLSTWAEIIETRLGNIKSRILVVDGTGSESKFSESISRVMDDGYKDFISKLKDLMNLLPKAEDHNQEYEKFKKEWESLKSKYAGSRKNPIIGVDFPETLSLIQEKLNATIFLPRKKAVAKIKAFKRGRLNLSGLRLLELPLDLIPIEKRMLITHLDLKNNRINELPQSINTLKALSKLNLEGNRLNSLPPELAELKNIEDLNINSNEFKTPGLPLIAKSRDDAAALLGIVLKKAMENSTLAYLRKLIKEGKMDAAFKEVREKLTFDPALNNDLDILEAQLTDIEKENNRGRIDRNTYKVEKAKIQYALLGFLSDLAK